MNYILQYIHFQYFSFIDAAERDLFIWPRRVNSLFPYFMEGFFVYLFFSLEWLKSAGIFLLIIAKLLFENGCLDLAFHICFPMRKQI